MSTMIHCRRPVALPVLILVFVLLLFGRSQTLAQSTPPPVQPVVIAEPPGPIPELTVQQGLPTSAYPSGVTYTSVAYGNCFFLACAQVPTRLYRSVDGLNWSQIGGPYLGPVSSLGNYVQKPHIAFGAGRFVLISDSGRIFSSADLVNWTKSVSGATANLLKARYIDSVFYVVGDSATFLSSRDAINWTTEHTGLGDSTGSYKDIIGGKGHLILSAVNDEFGAGAQPVVYDKVGGVWTENAVSGYPRFWFLKGQFYKTVANGLAFSTDFVNWTAATVPDSIAGSILDMYEDSSRVYVSGYVSSSPPPVNSPGDFVYVCSSDDGIHFGDLIATGVVDAENSAYFHHRYFVIGGRSGGPLAVSTDAVHYHFSGSDSSYLAYNGTTYVKMSTTPNEVHLYSSTDRIHWIAGDTLPNVVSLTYDSSKFRILGQDSYTSTDGVHWVNEGPPQHGFRGMAYGGGRYIAWNTTVGEGVDSVWYSTDGRSWTQAVTPYHYATGPKDATYMLGFGNVSKVRFYNGIVFVVSDNGTIATSTDGVNYRLGYAGDSTGHFLSDIVYDRDSARYYIYGYGRNTGGQQTVTAVAADPLQTNLSFQEDTVIDLPPGVLSNNFAINNVLYSHGHFTGLINLGDLPPYPANYFIWSTDGLHWDSHRLDIGSEITGAVDSGDTFLIEGTDNLELIADFSGTANPLPVTWLQFTASVQSNSTVLLNWQTGIEQNSKGFIIQRNTDDAPAIWDSIGWMPAAGNSAVPLSYSFTDNAPKNGGNNYRLLLMNLDGSSQASSIRRVYLGTPAAVVVYPNPVHDQLTIQMTGSAGQSMATLYDAGGRIVLQKGFDSNTTLSLKPLPPGVYQLIIRLPNGGICRKEILH